MLRGQLMILRKSKIFVNVKCLLKALGYVKLKNALLNDFCSQLLLIIYRKGNQVPNWLSSNTKIQCFLVTSDNVHVFMNESSVDGMHFTSECGKYLGNLILMAREKGNGNRKGKTKIVLFTIPSKSCRPSSFDIQALQIPEKSQGRLEGLHEVKSHRVSSAPTHVDIPGRSKRKRVVIIDTADISDSDQRSSRSEISVIVLSLTEFERWGEAVNKKQRKEHR
ncbi:hypothetical protein V1478_012607 [Vespula squamosa]|uniref:Uncharacterized protein n=1 Tax=Vespula squamosa TaxID=30214 RepID=A0ABD2A8M7_VESSQ